jgi:hypothetical protein
MLIVQTVRGREARNGNGGVAQFASGSYGGSAILNRKAAIPAGNRAPPEIAASLRGKSLWIQAISCGLRLNKGIAPLRVAVKLTPSPSAQTA